jgi:TRIC channel
LESKIATFAEDGITKGYFCRYFVFYTPFDIGYKIAKFLPIKLICAAMKEVYR